MTNPWKITDLQTLAKIQDLFHCHIQYKYCCEHTGLSYKQLTVASNTVKLWIFLSNIRKLTNCILLCEGIQHWEICLCVHHRKFWGSLLLPLTTTIFLYIMFSTSLVNWHISSWQLIYLISTVPCWYTCLANAVEEEAETFTEERPEWQKKVWAAVSGNEVKPETASCARGNGQPLTKPGEVNEMTDQITGHGSFSTDTSFKAALTIMFCCISGVSNDVFNWEEKGKEQCRKRTWQYLPRCFKRNKETKVLWRWKRTKMRVMEDKEEHTSREAINNSKMLKLKSSSDVQEFPKERVLKNWMFKEQKRTGKGYGL